MAVHTTRMSVAVACLAAALAPLLLRFHLVWLLANMHVYGWRIDDMSGGELQRQIRLGHQFSAMCRTASSLARRVTTLCKPTFEPLRAQARLNMNVSSLSEDPPVYVFDGLISRDECARALELTEDTLEPALVGGRTRLRLRNNKASFLVEDGKHLYAAEHGSAPLHQLIARIHSRVAVLFDVPLEYITLQRHRTLPGQFFRPHWDFKPKRLFLPSGPYVWQILLYCSDVADGAGGETRFPALGVQLRPQVGRALAWPSTFDATLVGDARLLHESVTLKRGVKHALFATINTAPSRLWGGRLEGLENWIDSRVLALISRLAG